MKGKKPLIFTVIVVVVLCIAVFFYAVFKDDKHDNSDYNDYEIYRDDLETHGGEVIEYVPDKSIEDIINNVFNGNEGSE